MHTFIAVQSAAAQFPHLVALGGHLSALAAGPTPPAGGGGSINTGDPAQITELFKVWSDAARKWMPFIVIFGCVLAYATLTLASRLGFEHLKNTIVGAFMVMIVIAIAPGLFA